MGPKIKVENKGKTIFIETKTPFTLIEKKCVEITEIAASKTPVVNCFIILLESLYFEKFHAHHMATKNNAESIMNIIAGIIILI